MIKKPLVPPRTTPFSTPEEAAEYHNQERFACLECGKILQYLPRHIRFVHEMTVEEYRDKWNIRRSVPLMGTEIRRMRSDSNRRRIVRGELNPREQVKMMHEALACKGRKKVVYSPMDIERLRKDIFKRKLWEQSPAIKVVDIAIKQEAVKRMKNRLQSGETVADISAEMNISISALYRWAGDASLLPDNTE